MTRSTHNLKTWLAAKSVIRINAEQLSPEDDQKLEQWYDHDEQFREDFLSINQGLARVEGLANDPDILAILDEPAVQDPLEPARKRWPMLSVAAGLVLAVGISLFTVFAPSTTDQFGANMQRYVTRTGEQKSVELSDGSVVTMNTGTQLLVDITEQYRRVILERGEAYFDVAHEPARPFTVSVDERSVSVLGTEFNLLKLPDEFTLAVFEGVVAIHDSDESALKDSPVLDGDGSVDISAPDQHRVVAGWVAEVNTRQNRLHAYQPQDMSSLTEWRSGMLKFNQVPLYQVVKELNRYSARKILIEDTEIMNLEIFGSIRVDSLNSALKGLEKTYPIRVVRHFDRIVIVGSDQ